MNNFTRLGKVLLLALCFTSLFGGSLQAQQNCNLSPIVTINDYATDADPVVNVNFQNFFLDGQVIIQYEPRYGGIGFNGLNFQTEVLEVTSGFTSFRLGEPRLPGISSNNTVTITEIEFLSPACQQSFGPTDAVGTYDFTDDSEFNLGPIAVQEPACPGSASGSIQFQFTNDDADDPGTNPATRFTIQVSPFTPGAIANVTPTSLVSGAYDVSVTQLVEGDYTVIITDTQEEYSITVSRELESGLDIAFSNTSDAGCFGEDNGEITIDASQVDATVNGVLSYSVFRAGLFTAVANGAITPTLTSGGFVYLPEEVEDLVAGNYTIFVTPAGQTGPGQQNCTVEGNIVIEEEDEITLDPITPIAVCGDATEYTIVFGGIGGADIDDVRFRLRDATRFDAINGTSTCFDGAANNFLNLQNDATDNNDGTYSFTTPLSSTGCYDINQDTTVQVVLQLRNADTQCDEEFEFTLQINAQPTAPMVIATADIDGGFTVNDQFCSGEEFDITVTDYNAAFDYFLSVPTLANNVTVDAAFANGQMVSYTGTGSVSSTVTNLRDGQTTVTYEVYRVNPTTGCISETTELDVRVRPEPTVTFPAADLTVLRCSGQRYRVEPVINDGNNADITFNYELTLPAGLTTNPGFALTGADLDSGDLLNPRFFNTTGQALMATLTITPVRNQNNQQTNGNGNVANDCSGEARMITITVSPEPTLNATANIGDNSIPLTSGDVVSEEICTGDVFLVDNLSFDEPVTGAQLAFVNVQVLGDADFLSITTPFEQDAPAVGFTLGSNGGVSNSTPNAQIARVILTPYFELDANNPDFVPNCAGEPIEIILTLNPAPPAIASPQDFTVCSGERVEESIAGAQGFETRITEFIVFDETETEYVVPAGADRIEAFQYTLSGANGGSTENAAGGLGATLSGFLTSAQLSPGDIIRVRRATASEDASAGSGAEGGDATVLTVIAGDQNSAGIPAGEVLYAFVAAGGGGAATGTLTGNAGESVSVSPFVTGFTTLTGDDGLPGAAPGGDGGTGFPTAQGGDGRNTGGGGGGGGYDGGNGGNSTNNTGGEAGVSGFYDDFYYYNSNVAEPTSMRNSETTTPSARVSFTVVYDDIRFTATSVDIPTGLTSTGENITDNAGEVDTILFGQQFTNDTDGPLDVTYVFSTQTEASCDGTSTVTVVLTVEPEPTGFLAENASSTSTLLGDADNGYTTTICSQDGFNFDLSTLTVPTNGAGTVFFTVDVDVDLAAGANTGLFGFNGNNSLAANALAASNTEVFSSVTAELFENGIRNNTGADATVTYTLTPFINDGSSIDCPGEPFTLTVTVQPGFANAQVVTPVTTTLCSDDVFGDAGFDLEASQPNLNQAIADVRLIDYNIVGAGGNPVAGFTAVTGTGVDTSGLANGGLLLGTDALEGESYENRTGARVRVDYTVRFVSADGCESNPVEYRFRIDPEPVISNTVTEFTVPSDSVLGTDVTLTLPPAVASLNYSFEAEAGLTYTGPGTMPQTNGNRFAIADDVWQNLTTESLDVVYTAVAIADVTGCTSDTTTFTFTIEPRVSVEVTAQQGDSIVTGVVTTGGVVPDTLTICSDTDVLFSVDDLLTDDTGVAYRIDRDVSNGADIDIDGAAPITFEGGQTDASFTETFLNDGATTQTIRYTFTGYTFGRNGDDNNGVSSSDDARGDQKRLVIRVLPAVDASTLQVDYFSPGNNGTYTYMGTNVATDTLCDATPVRFNVGTPLADGEAAFRFEQTNDGGEAGEVLFGDFSLFDNGGNNFSQIDRTVVNGTSAGVTYTYTFQSYTFGPNGIDDQLASGSDDCAGVTRTQTIYVEPVPVLTADLTINGNVQTLTASDELQVFELCSGDDLTLGGLNFTTSAVPGRAEYVQFSANGLGIDEAEFLGLTPNGGGVPTDIDGFLIGGMDVQNTGGFGYLAFISLTPYYEDDVNNPSILGDCSGESIDIVIVLNPEVTNIPDPQTLTVCSEEPVDFEIDEGQGAFSFATGSFDFSDGGEFVFPDNAAFIPLLSFEGSSANGGSSAANGLSGAPGLNAEGDINTFGGPIEPGDTLRAILGQPGTDGALAGSGGGATVLTIIGGPNQGANEGTVVSQIVLAGGGGAGRQEAAVHNINFSNAGTGMDGQSASGSMGFPGLTGPTFAGGASNNTAGGGGGGWIGGDGGSSVGGTAGESGESREFNAFTNSVNLKSTTDPAGSSLSISYAIAFDDVVFTVVGKETSSDPDFDASGAPLAIGNSGLDTLLNGETFVNNSDTAITVIYTLSTGTETGCPGNTIDVEVTVEPNPTIELASNGTTLMGDAASGYTATICSGDSLSATLFSNTIPSVGANRVRARVISAVESNPGDITITNTNNANASALNNFGGNNEVAVDDIPFYEGAINNVSDQAETVTYTIISLINNPNRPNCEGDTITLTVTVDPGFDPVDPTPAQFGLCSNVSLDDAGFDLDATQGLGQALNIGFDSLMIDSVRVVTVPAPGANFETINSVYSGSPVRVTRSGGFFGGDVYRNRTGGPVEVAYYVRLESAAGCLSEEIVYNFRYTAEPVIDETARIDTTVCNTEAIDLSVVLAANSAWFGNPGNVDYDINRVLPDGLTDEAGNAAYPATGVAASYIAGDAYENTTDGPLTVTYFVTPLNGTCLGDSVTFTATVLPNPDAEVTLTSLDSTASFSLENSRMFLNPNPAYGLCSGQALDVDVTGMADGGTDSDLRAFVTITVIDGTTMTAGTPQTFNIPAGELADSLSIAADEYINREAVADTVRVSYTTYFDRAGNTFNQGVAGGDCPSNGTVEFDIIISPSNEARVDVRVTDDNVFTPIPTGMDTLCSGELYDLAVRTASTTANDPNLPAIDSFLVEVDFPAGMIAGAGTEEEDFIVGNADLPFTNADFYFRRLDDLSWTNTTPGIKTVRYIATPFSGGCPGIKDTTTISIRPEILLKLDVPAVCIEGVYPITAEDQNQASSMTDADYDWTYIGGAPGEPAADFFSIFRGDGTGEEFVGPTNSAPIAFTDTRFLRIEAFQNTTPGTAQFELVYENDFGCTITETLTLTIGIEASAGTFDENVPIQCEGNTPIILDDYLDDADPGGSWTQISGPVLPTPGFNAGAGSLTANDLSAGGAVVEFGFRYIIGDGASGCTPDTTEILVEVQSAISAGTYTGTPLEACEAAAPINLYDALIGEESGGVFVQLSGTDNVFVDGADGVFDQTGITPGTYTYRYEVAGRNGCPGDDETLIVEVRSMADCSEPVPCDVINLTAGFNVISFDVIPNDNDVRAVFADEIASRNLLRVVGIQVGANNGNPQSINYLSILDDYVGDIDGGIQGGYGYIVQVESATTVEVCGVAVDPDLRVALQSGLNIVGYVPQSTEAVDSYFDDIIATGNLNLVRTVDNGLVQDRIYGVLPFPIGPLTTMQNGFGYLVDVDAAFGEGTWRTNARLNSTSVFDQFYGYLTGGEFTEGETIEFTDADGNVFGRTTVREDGLYYNAFAFGDLDNTEELTEGFLPEGKIYVRFRDQLIATGATFEGGWANRRLDVDLGEFTSPVSDVAENLTSIQVFPNPTQGMTTLVVDLDRAESAAQLEVINGLGQVVVSRKLDQLVAGEQQLDLDLTYLAAGTYRVRVYTAERMIGLQQVIRR